jgi:2-methylcitrate dehydratase PrpD
MILSTFARYAASLQDAALSPPVVHAAKRCLIDWFAATLPGGAMPPATLLADALRDDVGRGRSTLFPCGERATVSTAALINGAAAHTAELDDIFRDGLYHPGAPVIAAALAAAEDRGAGGDRLLRGIVAGYEISTRIAATVNPEHYNFWHTTGTVGTFGAACAAATVLGLDATGTEHALANAGTLAAGLQQAFREDAMSKPLHAGHAAQVGVQMALGAERGVTGVTSILDGPRGFAAAMSNAPDWSSPANDLGRVFNIANMTVKNHAACGHTFAAIDAARHLREAHTLSPEAIARIRIATYTKALEVAGAPNPTTAFEAKFSLPYCVAAALVTGSVRLDAFSPSRLDDPLIRDLMRKIELTADADADAAYPKQRAATVSIDTTDGRQVSFRAPTRKGDPDNPLTDAELVDKFHELAGANVGQECASRLLEYLWTIDTIAPVAFVPLFERAARA